MTNPSQTILQHSLIIDDDEINNFVCKKLILSSGFSEEVSAIQSAEEGVDFLRQAMEKGEKMPEVIFLDINMPVTDGWAFLEMVKPFFENLEHRIPIYMLSSSIYELDVERADQEPLVEGYITKPLSEQRLNEIATKLKEKKEN